jgi:hypothetical protein
MPTQKQEKAFNIRTKKIKENKPVYMGRVMREAGYSEKASKHPKRLTNSDGWQELLARYDDEPILNAIYKDALDSKDKRNATTNRKLFLQVKGKLKEQHQHEIMQFEEIPEDKEIFHKKDNKE